MTFAQLLESLKASLQPKGSANVVRLAGGYYNGDAVQGAISHFENMVVSGEKANPLEKIAIEVLLDTIGHRRG